MVAIFFLLSGNDIPTSRLGMAAVSLLLAVAGLVSLAAFGMLVLGWRRLSTKQRIELLLLALFL